MLSLWLCLQMGHVTVLFLVQIFNLFLAVKSWQISVRQKSYQSIVK